MSNVCQPCAELKNSICKKNKQTEDCFIRISNNIFNNIGNSNSGTGGIIGDRETGMQLKKILSQHKNDLIAQRRALAATTVYEINNNGILNQPAMCLELINTDDSENLRAIENDLGLPKNKLTSSDFSNEKNGFRAAVFYDQRDEKYVVTFRGTNKNNLIDWKNNVNNQLPNARPENAPSYFAAKNLGSLLKDAIPPVEYTGHSKGGGEVYEALSQSYKSVAFVFNSAGPSPRISQSVKENISTRTKHYQVGGEMLNLIQNESDPEKTIENMKWLKKQVDTGIAGSSIAVKIVEIDNILKEEKETLKKKTGFLYNSTEEEISAQNRIDQINKSLENGKKDFIAQLEQQIEEKEQWLEAKKSGKTVPPWSPPFAKALGEERILGGDKNRKSVDSGATGTAALSDHTMSNMNNALEKQILKDKKEIERAARAHDPNFDKKLAECSNGL